MTSNPRSARPFTAHNLEWAIKGESDGDPIINYKTRLLGRGGVMRVTLVADPEILRPTLPDFKDLLSPRLADLKNDGG
jgi:uncharacterized membrane-anchored protein